MSNVEPCRRHAIVPRLIRLRDAGRYLGMDPNRFNAEVRPFLTEIPIGIQGVAFDRLEMDAWVDDRSRNGRPPRKEASWQRELRHPVNREIDVLRRVLRLVAHKWRMKQAERT